MCMSCDLESLLVQSPASSSATGCLLQHAHLQQVLPVRWRRHQRDAQLVAPCHCHSLQAQGGSGGQVLCSRVQPQVSKSACQGHGQRTYLVHSRWAHSYKAYGKSNIQAAVQLHQARAAS